METLSERITRLRIAKGYSQRFLAERTGVTVASISRIENGEHKPRLDSLHPMARALGVTLDLLVTGRETPQLAALHRAILIGTPAERLVAMVRGDE